MIGALKKQMQRSLERRRYSHKEIFTIFQETMQIMNRRRLTAGRRPEMTPICPANLMIKRAIIGYPQHSSRWTSSW